jgi:hypothetical protein
MQPQLYFFVNVAFSLIAWGIVAKRYIWPKLRLLGRAEALRPLLVLHSFRFLGLAFLVPGVVSPALPSVFAHSATYGDLIAATLAMLSLVLLPGGAGVVIAWVYQANAAGLMAGQLGAAYFLPTLVVPLLLITHCLIFRILLQHQSQSGMREADRLAKGYQAEGP